MGAVDPIGEAVAAFAEHVRYSEMDDSVKPEQYLGPWFVDWIRHGNGVEHTARSFEGYLRVCLHVADAVLRGGIELHSADNSLEISYRRDMVGIDNPEDPSHFDDRLFYERAVTRWEFQGRVILWIEEY